LLALARVQNNFSSEVRNLFSTTATSPPRAMRARLTLALAGCAVAGAAAPFYLPRAMLAADTLVTCHFVPLVGLFDDLVWQSGSTLESLADTMVLAGAAAPARWAVVPAVMFERLPVIVDVRFARPVAAHPKRGP